MTKNKQVEELESLLALIIKGVIVDVVQKDGIETCKLASKFIQNAVKVFNTIDCEIKVAQEDQTKKRLQEEANQKNPSLN